MVETPQTSGFTAATSEDKDGAVEDDPGPSFFHLLTEHDGWREIDGAEAAVRRAYDAAVAMLPDMLAERDVSVVLSSDEAVAALNARYRGKNRPTNVLSFPAAPLAPVIEGEKPPLGDVIIARETLISEATDEKTPLLFHLSHLTVHGLLHLAGFDHETDREAERMEAQERLILASIGIPDPYSSTTDEAPGQTGK
jgi:probable rRNA maturation factor